MPRPRRIEGYAIVSEDGMIANAAGIMPDSLKFEADRNFFERGLDAVDVVVHGRHSHERQPRSYLRRRLILTRQVPTIAADPSNEKALFWNPAGASSSVQCLRRQKIAHLPLDFLCKQSVSGGQRSPYAEAAPTLKTLSSSPPPAPLCLRGVAVVAARWCAATREEPRYGQA
jgi:hypothetical protein